MGYLFLVLFLVAAGLNAAAQLLLKKGSLISGSMLTATAQVSTIGKLFNVLLNPYIASAIVCLVAGLFIWIKILSRIELSRAYPINIALTIILTATTSIFLFDESMSWAKAAGIVFIIGGIWAILV